MPVEIKQKVSFLEETLNRFILSTNEMMYEMTKDTAVLKDEMREFKDETREASKQFQEENKNFRKEMNKKWGELANKMGTIVEDIVSPAVRPMIKIYFKEDTDQDFMINVRRQRKSLNLKGEFDVIAVSDKKVYLVETKSTPRKEYLEEFEEKINRFRQLYPEHKNRKLVPIFASLRFEKDFIPLATEKGFYLMAYREWEYMDLLNFEEVQKIKA